jgi:hypothetical protein
MDAKSQCPLCPVVARIAFWGPRPERSWKRPALFVFSLAILLVLGWLVVVVPGPHGAITWLGLVVLALISVLGLSTSIRGCDACVARLFGDL